MTNQASPGPKGSGSGGGRTALVAVGGLLVLVVGLASILAPDRDAALRIFGGFLTAIGLLSVAASILEFRWSRRRPGAQLGVAPDGSPATVLARAPWAVWMSAAMLVALTAGLLAGAGLAAAREAWVWAAAFAAPGLWFGSLLLPFVLGRIPAGGVVLTSRRLINARDGGSWEVAWDDITGVVPGEPTAVLLRPGAEVSHTRGPLRGWRTSVPAPDGVLGIQTRHLAEGPEVLAFLVLAYAKDPSVRGQLGTEESLRWAILSEQ
jgi:hypothetical protein